MQVFGSARGDETFAGVLNLDTSFGSHHPSHTIYICIHLNQDALLKHLTFIY